MPSKMTSTMRVLRSLTAFRTTPPFDELSPALNIFRVNVSSTDSGADDPASDRRHGCECPHLL